MIEHKEVTITTPNLSWVLVNSFFIDYTPATISLQYGDVVALVDKWDKRARPWISFIYHDDDSIHVEERGEFYFINNHRYGVKNSSLIAQNFSNLEGLRDDEIDDLAYLSQSKALGEEDCQNLERLSASLEVCASQNLTDKDTQYLSELDNLKFLDLCGSHVTGQSLSHLTQLSDIQGLQLEETTINDDDLQFLAKFKHLNFLDLQNVAISSKGIEQIDNHLKSLNIRSTHVCDHGINKITHFHDLSTLKMQKCPITNRSFEHIASLENIHSLALGWMSLENTHCLTALQKIKTLQFTRIQAHSDNLRWVASLPNLEALYFWKVSMTRDVLDRLEQNQKLKKLFLRWLAPEAIPFDQLPQLKFLETLSFRGTRVSNEQMSYLSPLKGLIKLDLTDTKVTDSGLEALTNLHNLQSLFLWKTEITDQSISSLSQLQRLQVLDVSQTLMTPNAIQKLQENLPQCLIYA